MIKNFKKNVNFVYKYRIKSVLVCIMMVLWYEKSNKEKFSNSDPKNVLKCIVSVAHTGILTGALNACGELTFSLCELWKMTKPLKEVYSCNDNGQI